MSSNGGSQSQSVPSNLDNQTTSTEYAINLIDSTQTNEAIQSSRTRSQSPGWRRLTRDVTRNSVRDSINRRKYAKWNQERFDSSADVHASVNSLDGQSDPDDATTSRPAIQPHESSEVVDFAHPQESSQPARRERKQKPQPKDNKELVIDILYENQRGSFFCGIPLYSHSSLLQFDPAPWVTKDYKDSAVNITNAQVPDPSWQWDWKHWYVDMSGDVDEDGWQYSFAFFGNFAWHGTHPWFHSYVRRRRWLRRRVKKASLLPGRPQPSSMSAAHRLNADYFTIHSRRAGNAARPADEMSQIGRAESYVSYRSAAMLEEERPEDLTDIGSLLKALRLASVDREKLDAIKRFVDVGGEELLYLQGRIAEIMSFLVFQDSKRQLLKLLRQELDEAQARQNEQESTSKSDREAELRRVKNIQKAIDVMDAQSESFGSVSDRRQSILLNEDTNGGQSVSLKTIFDQPSPSPRLDPQPAAEIKGISERAEVGHDHTTQVSREVLQQDRQRESTKQEKGKAVQGAENEMVEAESPPRLDHDQLFVPDKEA